MVTTKLFIHAVKAMEMPPAVLMEEALVKDVASTVLLQSRIPAKVLIPVVVNAANVVAPTTFSALETYAPPAVYSEVFVGVDVLISEVLFALRTPLRLVVPVTESVELAEIVVAVNAANDEVPDTVRVDDNVTAPMCVVVVPTYRLLVMYAPPAP